MRNHAIEKPSGRGRIFDVITVVLIVFLSVVLVLLIIENRRYRALLTGAGVIERTDALKPGERIDDVAITTLDGEPGILAFSGENDKYLLFVLSTDCPHCLANLGRWGDISRRLGPSGRYVVGLSVHGPRETAKYIEENDVRFYTVTVRDSSFLDRYRIPGVPATLLLSTGGIVRQVWIGELTDSQVSDVIDQTL